MTILWAFIYELGIVSSLDNRESSLRLVPSFLAERSNTFLYSRGLLIISTVVLASGRHHQWRQIPRTEIMGARHVCVQPTLFAAAATAQSRKSAARSLMNRGTFISAWQITRAFIPERGNCGTYRYRRPSRCMREEGRLQSSTRTPLMGRGTFLSRVRIPAADTDEF